MVFEKVKSHIVIKLKKGKKVKTKQHNA